MKDYLAVRRRETILRLVEAKTFTNLPWVAWTGETQLCPEHRYGRSTWCEYLQRVSGRI